MNIGILITSVSNFGEKGFYNCQEIGLAKALSYIFSNVDVYKLISINQSASTETLYGYNNVTIHTLPSKNIGINGMIDTECLSSNIDAMIHFSDTQLSVPKVYRWCKKNKVRYMPYIGVISSHSENKTIKTIIEFLFKRNISVYKHCSCCVKTPVVQQELAKLGINNSTVVPVGLDMDLMKKDYSTVNTLYLKEKYGYESEDKILLFIGRLVEEKQPLKMIDIFSEVHKKDKNFKLFMVGNGELKEKVISKIKELNLENSIQMIDKIPNNDIWELYRISDAFINLNQQEIFGMAILEAMYYGCKVVALEAPGPDYIIEHGLNGYLAKSDAELTEYILNSNDDISLSAHERIVNKFTWQNSAETFAGVIR